LVVILTVLRGHPWSENPEDRHFSILANPNFKPEPHLPKLASEKLALSN